MIHTNTNRNSHWCVQMQFLAETHFRLISLVPWETTFTPTYCSISLPLLFLIVVYHPYILSSKQKRQARWWNESDRGMETFCTFYRNSRWQLHYERRLYECIPASFCLSLFLHLSKSLISQCFLQEKLKLQLSLEIRLATFTGSELLCWLPVC